MDKLCRRGRPSILGVARCPAVPLVEAPFDDLSFDLRFASVACVCHHIGIDSLLVLLAHWRILVSVLPYSSIPVEVSANR